MDPFTIMIGSMVASGAGFTLSLFSKNQQIKTAEQGERVEQAGILANMQSIRLQSAEQSLESIKKLRQNLATQTATFAARGTATNIGSAFFVQEHSVNEFNREERFQRLSEKSKLAGASAQSLMSSLNLEKTRSQAGEKQVTRLLNMLPISSMMNFANQNAPTAN